MEHNDKHIDKNLVLMLNLLAEWNIMINTCDKQKQVCIDVTYASKENTLTRIELKIKQSNSLTFSWMLPQKQLKLVSEGGEITKVEFSSILEYFWLHIR